MAQSPGAFDPKSGGHPAHAANQPAIATADVTSTYGAGSQTLINGCVTTLNVLLGMLKSAGFMVVD